MAIVQFQRTEFGTYVLPSDGKLYYRKNNSTYWVEVEGPGAKSVKMEAKSDQK